MHLGRLPFRVFERRRRQRLQGSPLDLLEQFAAALADMAHRPVVQLLEQFGDRRVELDDREEGSIPQPRQNPALDDQHRALDLALLSSPGLQFVLTLERV